MDRLAVETRRRRARGAAGRARIRGRRQPSPTWARFSPRRLTKSGAIPRRHGELEGRSAPVARGDPDPAAERALDHQAAKVEPESEPALRAVAARRPRLLEQGVQARRLKALPAVGDGDLEPP